MKGITFKILKTLEDGAISIADMMAIVSVMGSDSRYSTTQNNLRKVREAHALSSERRTELQVIYNTIYRLKRSGLISGKNSKLRLTVLGREKVAGYAMPEFVDRKVRYDKSDSKELIVFSFDIPERERHKRHWLRTVLSNLDFRMLQQSVWVGNFKLPEELIEDLKRFEMIKYVEILSVGRKGTIKDYELP